MSTTTFGTGELILHALDKGAQHIILGIGGSATNDCGIGMASALGYQFFDERNNQITPIGRNLAKVTRIDDSQVEKRLAESFHHLSRSGAIRPVRCSVSAPLLTCRTPRLLAAEA